MNDKQVEKIKQLIHQNLHDTELHAAVESYLFDRGDIDSETLVRDLGFILAAFRVQLKAMEKEPNEVMHFHS